MEENNDYLNTMHRECCLLREIADHIKSLSRAFGRTGNDTLSRELSEISADIHTAQDYISKAVGKDIHNRCEESHRQVGETLKIVLDAAMKS